MLQDIFAANESDENYDHGDHEKNMDEATQGIGCNDSEEPQNDKYDGDSPKHRDNIRGG